MKAMILAAGRGERLRPLTDHTPKPLLPVAGQPLIVWHLRRLREAGIQQLVINCAWLAEVLQAYLGDGAAYDVTITWSHEEQALETAGGIIYALPLLGEEPFVLVNADIFANIDFHYLVNQAHQLTVTGRLAHLVMVDNPAHHPQGDFTLHEDGLLTPGDALTYAGTGVYHPALFSAWAEPQAKRALPLRPVLSNAMHAHRITGVRHTGYWLDVGTPERLAAAQRLAMSREQV